MYEDINELIDRNLNIIHESIDNQFMITHFVGGNGKKLNLLVDAQRFASIMESKGLINVHGHFANIEEFGNEVYNYGGWKKYIADSVENELKKELFEQQKKDLEFEKTQIDLVLAKRMLAEYPKTKWFARIGFGIAISLAILEIVKMIIQLRSKC